MKRAVVQSETSFHGVKYDAGTIPWDVHLKAWVSYDAAGHGDQSAERINERGGFGYHELQCLLAGHYTLKCSGSGAEHLPVPGWEPRT